MGLFFVSWELWQQMTFVLAMAIVIVFCMGLTKLWWSNRIMRKQEIIDEEKRARVTDMRKTGLSLRRPNAIPFGVRAIQSGIEVDGIWVSRPATPSPNANMKPASSATTLVGIDARSEKKTPYVEDLISVSSSPEPSSNASSRAGSAPRPPKQRPANSKHSSLEAAVILNQKALKKLEAFAQSTSKPAPVTYKPTFTQRDSHHIHSESSSSMDSTQSDVSSAESYASSEDLDKPLPGVPRAMSHHSRMSYNAATPEVLHMARSPFDTPLGTPQGASFPQNIQEEPMPTQEVPAKRRSRKHSIAMPPREPSAPQPTFGPGDMRANRHTRQVNPGFEVLPSGTFGTPETHRQTPDTARRSAGVKR